MLAHTCGTLRAACVGDDHYASGHCCRRYYVRHDQ